MPNETTKKSTGETVKRRGFLIGLAAALAAPAVIRIPNLLMPVRPLTPVADWLELQMLLGKTVTTGEFRPERGLVFGDGACGMLVGCNLTWPEDRRLPRGLLNFREGSSVQIVGGTYSGSAEVALCFLSPSDLVISETPRWVPTGEGRLTMQIGCLEGQIRGRRIVDVGNG